MFERELGSHRHWRLEIEPPVATLTLAVDPAGGWRDDYELKLNSYDVTVDIELRDLVERLRFEHPEVHVVVVTGGLDKVFCAGANIQMLAGASHVHKVNFCKLTNETRNAIEQASAESGQVWIAAVNGTAAGGGYELALACDEIVLVDDRASTVSLPEVPLLGVLPGTGGLTRVIDKRHVRRDLADVFATRAEGVRGQQAVDWGLVDEVAPASRFSEAVRRRALARAAASDRPSAAPGVALRPLQHRSVSVTIDADRGAAEIVVSGPHGVQPATPEEIVDDSAWFLAAARELDDAILRLRFDEPEIGTWILRPVGDPAQLLDAEELLARHADDWLVREIRLLWTRVLKRLDVSARTLFALVEPGGCAAGTLAELVLAADRAYMLAGSRPGDDLPEATLRLTDANLGWYAMSNGLSRLATRFWGRAAELEVAQSAAGKDLLAEEALDLGLVTFAPDELDWDDEVRVALEERAGFSPDALSGLEANLRFPGPETMETKIFARLSAWQNWIFQRPNAVGEEGALRRYGTGTRPAFDRRRAG